MNRYICIHGHFYQPPRENPWLETVEQQDSAYPYHDWNERITEECYASNAASRILNEKKQIVKILNNYATISFNFGPTLLSWLAEKFPSVYQAILQADKDSQQRFEGHGNAIAQAYNHTILPLCNLRDKYTQIIWGIRDFVCRFQRNPEGLWLPETAVDLESLTILAEQGILFTILAQRQAKRFRKIDAGTWQDIGNEQIDPTMPYLLNLPRGQKIIIFFYDGAVSQQVAFSSLLNKGENFANKLIDIFSDKCRHPQLAHIATDGETYGHHHPHGDMALAYALNYIEEKNLAKITNYSQFLQKFPPTDEVEIFENSSWSCIHGIERWKSACGCNTGSQRDWNQNWRKPLRETFDWLRDNLIPVYEEKARNFFKDPWDARNSYIDVIMNRSTETLQTFFEKTTRHPLSDIEQQSALCLLEMQRHAMLMYTSCGWFFDDLSGIETVQVISYAARAVQLSEKFFGNSLEKQFIEKLSNAKSNLKNFGDGREIYYKIVKPCMLDWRRVGAHYTISHLFNNYEQKKQIYCYKVERGDSQNAKSGNFQFIMGHGEFKSIITTESAKLAFAAIHFGDQNINCGVSELSKILDYSKTMEELHEAFYRGDIVSVNNKLIQYFGESTYSINSLFRDEQRQVLNQILENTLKEVETAYTQLYNRHIALMRFIENLNIPLPESFLATAEHVINSEIMQALGKEKLKVTHILKLLKDAELAKIKLNKIDICFILKNNLEKMMLRAKDEPHSSTYLEHISHAMEIVNHLPFSVNLFQVQNIFYELLNNIYPETKKSADMGDESAKAWVDTFLILGNQLSVQI